MKIHTKILLDKSLNVRQRYSQILQKYYETNVENADFANSSGISQDVDNWISNITNNEISNFVAPSKSKEIEVNPVSRA